MNVATQARPVDVLPEPPLALLEQASLFLDFDGTLVAIAERPDGVVVDQRLERLMATLTRLLDGRLAVISGRAMADIDRLLTRGSLPVGASHGIELRFPGGRQAEPPRPRGLDQIVTSMRALQADYPQIIVEEKPFGVALHYRQAPEAEEACRALAAQLAQRDGVALQTGKMVFELRAAGHDKGTALEALMADPKMHATRPIFIGDDDTDEAGFAAATRLGGAGILVGPPRATAATYHLADVPAVLSWLERATAVEA